MSLPTSERETLKSNLDLIDKVEKALGDLPFRLAVPAVQTLGELRDCLCEVLPGGLYTFCESCELPIGCDEESATDPEGDTTLCAECIKRYEPSAA